MAGEGGKKSFNDGDYTLILPEPNIDRAGKFGGDVEGAASGEDGWVNCDVGNGCGFSRDEFVNGGNNFVLVDRPEFLGKGEVWSWEVRLLEKLSCGG